MVNLPVKRREKGRKEERHEDMKIRRKVRKQGKGREIKGKEGRRGREKIGRRETTKLLERLISYLCHGFSLLPQTPAAAPKIVHDSRSLSKSQLSRQIDPVLNAIHRKA